MAGKKLAIWIVIAAAAGTVAALVVFGIRHWRPRWTIVQGAVIRKDKDLNNQSPIADVQIAGSYGDERVTTQSDANGYFRIDFPGTVLPGQTVKITFRHPDYMPVDRETKIRISSSLRQLVIVPMAPLVVRSPVTANHATSAITNMRVRYTVNSQREENVGSAVRTFQVVNRGNVPCDHQSPCSPDGLWKAATKSIQLDAGTGNQFRDTRISCIAGPCPFTRIEPTLLADAGRMMTISAIDWSDTATFLVESEVFHTALGSQVRESYPVVFERELSFTLPSNAEGVSLEAELNGEEMVFPLGPDLNLSWADCAARPSADGEKSIVYQCRLKPDYRF